MSPATIKLWQVIEREVDSGEKVSLSHEAILAAVSGNSNDATDALNQLLQSGVLRAVTDEELQLLGGGKVPRGRLMILHGPAGTLAGIFCVKKLIEQYRSELSGNRETLRLKIRQIVAESGAKKVAFSAKVELLRRQISRNEEVVTRTKTIVEAAKAKVDIEAQRTWINRQKFATPEQLNLTVGDTAALLRAVDAEFGPNVTALVKANAKLTSDGILEVTFSPDVFSVFRGLTEIEMRNRLRKMADEASQAGGDLLFANLLEHTKIWRLQITIASYDQAIASSELRFTEHQRNLTSLKSQLAAAESQTSAAPSTVSYSLTPMEPIDPQFAGRDSEASAALTKLQTQLDLVETELRELPIEPQYKRENIPKDVRREVWRRDQGRCCECGSKERLHYDHIIPVSKGGANTARNLQLLCEPCNLAKSDKI